MRAKCLALPLLVTRVGRADDHGAPVPLDDAAVVAHGLDRRAYFHELPVPEGDPTAVQVVRAELHLDLVPGEDADVVLPHLSGDSCQHRVAAVYLHPEHGAR